ncbi:hypothetical protein WJX77_010697 [Trebouxia sp. C0004]
MPKLFNDVTTDAQNPPHYNKAQIGDVSEQNKKLILETYPDLKPLRFPFKDQATVFGAMVAAAKEMPRWQLTHQDQAKGILEGVATTAIMRFKDDFVFVCKQDSAGNTVVHGRSKSRLGSSDFGANAHRIQQYFKLVEALLR